MNLLGEICRILEEDSKTVDGGPLIDETPIVEFQQGVENMRKNLSEILEEGRVLRLGVVGEVKAGKSSFLNAVLFDGRDVLPKAPTPMTAALTRLSYSSTPEAKIHFYSDIDWLGIEKMARKYDEKIDSMYSQYCHEFQKNQTDRNFFTAQLNYPDTRRMKNKEEFESLHKQELPPDWAACKEVVEMVRKQGINPHKYAGSDPVILKTGNGNRIQGLDDYVGAGGRYTPLVKYTEIKLDEPMLKGVEIVDTPGLNDPVISRTRTTQGFLIQCDAVFLLSYCGQFLGAEDMSFIISALPKEGISKAVLIGSKFDSTILQYSKRNATFKQAYLGTKRNCEDQARKNISECKVTAIGSRAIEQIEQSLPPLCTSSMAFSIATKLQSGTRLNEEEQHTLTQLSKRFSDFNKGMLMGMSCIPDARTKAFDETIAQKKQIIKERTQSFLNTQKERFLSGLEEIYSRTSTSKSDLENFDCAQDEELLRKMKQRLASVRSEVKDIFDQAANAAQWSVREIVLEALDEVNNHLQIETTTKTKTEHHQSTKGALWWKHTDHWDEIITTHVTEVRDAEKNLRQYRDNCLRIINNGFRHMINLDDHGGLKDRVKGAVMKAFDQYDQDFDENRILNPMNTALGELIIPDISLTLDKYTGLLDEKLAGIVSGGEVRNENIPQLKRAHDQVLNVMAEDIQKLVEQHGKDICDKMSEQASVFVDNISGELEDNHERLEKQIKHKKENLQRYENFIQKLSNVQKTLQETPPDSLLQDGQPELRGKV